MSRKTATKKGKTESLDVIQVEQASLTACVLGASPIILNRISEKALHELLYPSPPKSTADKKTSMKHNPLKEYQSSPYKSRSNESPTRLLVRGASFVEALRSVALDIPGSNKTEVTRSTSVPGEYVELYGIPKLFMTPARNSDRNRTPDLRTRAIVPEWACYVTVSCTTPVMNINTVAQFLAAAGLMRGIGDWRPEKGGVFGKYQIVDADDKRFLKILKSGGRVAQDVALQKPSFYDLDSEELFNWFEGEKKRRKEVKRVA